MEHTHIPRCNGRFDPPKDHPEVSAVPVRVENEIIDGQAIPTITTYWKPTELDIANILAGGVVACTWYGTGLAPHRLHIVEGT